LPDNRIEQRLGIVRKDKKNTFTPRLEAISGFVSITAT
jgi:hypothetical protein